MPFIPGLKASRASGGQTSFVPFGGTNPDKKGPFVPVGGSTRDKRPNPFIPGGTFVPVGVTNPDKRALRVIVQKEVILY